MVKAALEALLPDLYWVVYLTNGIPYEGNILPFHSMLSASSILRTAFVPCNG